MCDGQPPEYSMVTAIYIKSDSHESGGGQENKWAHHSPFAEDKKKAKEKDLTSFCFTAASSHCKCHKKMGCAQAPDLLAGNSVLKFTSQRLL